MKKWAKIFVSAFGIAAMCGVGNASATVFNANFSGQLMTAGAPPSISGAGTITVAGDTGIGPESFSVPGNLAYAPPAMLTGLNIQIGGLVFTLADAASSAAIFNTLNGNAVGLNYYGNLYSGPPGRNSIIANLSVMEGTFSLADYANQLSYAGSVVYSRSVAEIPEPLTFTVLGCGLIGLFAVRRRRAQASSVSNQC